MTTLKDVEKRFCKQCSYPIGDCDNTLCKLAHAQGFCGHSCRDTYQAIKEYELSQARKTLA